MTAPDPAAVLDSQIVELEIRAAQACACHDFDTEWRCEHELQALYVARADIPQQGGPSLIRPIVNIQLALCLLHPLEDNPYLDGCIRDLCTALADAAGRPVDGTAVHDAFVHLLDTEQRLHDLDENRDEYLASMRLPRTDEQYDVTRGELLADRETWVRRLEEMGR